MKEKAPKLGPETPHLSLSDRLRQMREEQYHDVKVKAPRRRKRPTS